MYHLVQVVDDGPNISEHPDGEENDAGKLAEQQQQAEVMDLYLPHALRSGEEDDDDNDDDMRRRREEEEEEEEEEQEEQEKEERRRRYYYVFYYSQLEHKY